MTSILAGAALAAALVAAAPASFAAPGLPSGNVAWQPAAADADVERAFSQARAQGKPVLLYWGASWCPPCNQLKVTLFNRQEFASLSRSFVALAVDGDLPGAQKLGRRFAVSGYPTLVLFDPWGKEITRLPGQVDASQVMAELERGLAGGRSANAVLADALAGKALAANDWRMLAFYAWETDEGRLVPAARRPATLLQLARSCPAGEVEVAARLALQALAGSEEGKPQAPDALLRGRAMQVLAEPLRTRELADLVSGSAAEIVRALEPGAGPARAALTASYDAALQRLQADATLSRGDRVTALYGRVELARLELPKDAVQVQLPQALLADVREQVARADREITDGYERQAVITEAAALLEQAGLWAEGDALLLRNLERSPAPYYLMSQLGRSARKQGRTDEALRWYRQAFERSEGPATRLQWGSGYLAALVELAPADAVAIETTAAMLLAEAARDPGAFEGRSVRSLQRAGARLVAWDDKGRNAAVMRRLQAQLGGLCAKVDRAQGQRAACLALLKAAPGKAS